MRASTLDARQSDRGRESGIGRSPSLRTGRAVLPHPALQSVVLPRRGVMNDQSEAPEITSEDRRRSRLAVRVITMSQRRDQRSRFRRRRTEPSAGTARRHWAQGMGAAVHPCSSTFLRPFAPDPLQALLRSYGRSDSCSLRRGSAGIIVRRPPVRLQHEQVSLIHALGLPAIPSPTTCGRSASPRHVTCRRVEPRPHPHGRYPNGNSGLRHSLAGSPHHTGRIEFVSLRTDHSPPAALHLVSRRRSCSRLQVTLTWRGLSPLRPSALPGAPVPGLRPVTPATSPSRRNSERGSVTRDSVLMI
jgi:hypothetical protein